ncbi:MAG: VWA domain-containing protein [Terriglobia bacterium]
MLSSLSLVRRPGPVSPLWLVVVLLAACTALVPCILRAQKESDEEVSTRDVEPTFKLQVERNLVVVRVVVRDAKGAAVDNLRKEDFELFDRGKPQTILHFSVEKPAPKPAEKPAEKKPPAELEATEETEISPAAARRFLALYVEDVHTPFEGLVRTRDAADHYLAASLQPGDRVGLFTASGQHQLDFTDDFAKVHQALFELRPRPITGKDMSCAVIPPYEAYLIVEQRDPNALDIATDEVMNCEFGGDPRFLQQAQSAAQAYATGANSMAETESRAALRGIESLVRHMSSLPGQRSVVIVSSGFLTEALHSELGEIIDRALRANVVLNALDARGLYLDPGVPDASQARVANTNRPEVIGRKSQLLSYSAKLESAGMAALAQDTGGVFFQNSNDLEAGFRRAAALPDPYYVLAFSPQNLRLDGAFHPIKVKLVSQPGLTLQARRGYYAPRKADDPTVREKEEIEEAVFSQDEMQELPIEVHTQFFMKSQSDAQLAVLTRLDLHQVHFRKQEDCSLDNLTFVTALFDRDGHLVTGQQKLLQLRLRDATLARYLQTGITLKTHFDVKPGTYLVRAVVRDSESGQISGLNRTVEIPY